MKFFLVAILASSAASSVMAGTVTPDLLRVVQNYTYDLTLPTFTGSTENDAATFDFKFSWLGPLMYNAGPNTSCPLGCPVSGTTPGTPGQGYTYAQGSGISFTASLSSACTATPSGGCAEVIIPFQDSVGDTLTFTLIEPDSFWATSGAQSFTAGDGQGGIGASYAFVYATRPSLDPGCTGCSVSTSTSSVTPEPASSAMFAGGLASLIFAFRKRRR